MEPNQYFIRVLIESIQTLAGRCGINPGPDCRSQRQANKNSCFFCEGLTRATHFLGNNISDAYHRGRRRRRSVQG